MKGNKKFWTGRRNFILFLLLLLLLLLLLFNFTILFV